jgi:biopolymer transport protein ExbB/TolQ
MMLMMMMLLLLLMMMVLLMMVLLLLLLRALRNRPRSAAMRRRRLVPRCSIPRAREDSDASSYCEQPLAKVWERLEVDFDQLLLLLPSSSSS